MINQAKNVTISGETKIELQLLWSIVIDLLVDEQVKLSPKKKKKWVFHYFLKWVFLTSICNVMIYGINMKLLVLFTKLEIILTWGAYFLFLIHNFVDGNIATRSVLHFLNLEIQHQVQHSFKGRQVLICSLKSCFQKFLCKDNG